MHWQQTHGEFKLQCWHNGLSYELTHLPSGKSAFVQGDAASIFEDDLATIERCFPAWDYSKVYAWLWDQCDYGAISTTQTTGE